MNSGSLNPILHLKPGRERSLLRRHPWIFSGAGARVEGDPAPGATVDLLAADGSFLARASYSPQSQIRARVLTYDPAEQIDTVFFRSRIEQSIQARQGMLTPDTTSARLVFAESDGLPGVVIDRYADLLVAQFLTAGAEAWRETIADLLVECTGLVNVYERSDADVRQLEGLPIRTGALRGNPPQLLQVVENGLKFQVDIATGHKTGFYLDQRVNRQMLQHLAKGRDVLDCFCFTGGFTINALAGGAASVLSVDASAAALQLCRQNIDLNSLDANRQACIEGDVFQLLRKFRDEGRDFDMVILDPPKFAPTSVQAEKASRGYKDINLLAFKLLRPGGLLFTFSCSGGVDASLFQKIVASAALDASVDAQIIHHLSQAPDHPVALHFPESAYLKGLVCRRI